LIAVRSAAFSAAFNNGGLLANAVGKAVQSGTKLIPGIFRGIGGAIGDFREPPKTYTSEQQC